MNYEYHEEIWLTNNVRIEIYHNKSKIVSIDLVSNLHRSKFTNRHDGRLKRILNNYNKFDELASALDYLEIKLK